MPKVSSGRPYIAKRSRIRSDKFPKVYQAEQGKSGVSFPIARVAQLCLRMIRSTGSGKSVDRIVLIYACFVDFFQF